MWEKYHLVSFCEKSTSGLAIDRYNFAQTVNVNLYIQ